jgi:cytoskeletal protein CcmA (bactofilin family)
MIERKCSRCSAYIKIDIDSKKITIESTGPLCGDCIEFIRTEGKGWQFIS